MVEPGGETMDLSSDAMDLEVGQCSIDMPICIDGQYNLIVCKDCCIGVPFEWVPAHLKDHHGIRATGDQALAFLGLESNALTVEQAEDWIQNVWIARAVQNIPVVRGFKCNACQYSAAT
jgi:hypothetical protein